MDSQLSVGTNHHQEDYLIMYLLQVLIYWLDTLYSQHTVAAVSSVKVNECILISKHFGSTTQNISALKTFFYSPCPQLQ